MTRLAILCLTALCAASSVAQAAQSAAARERSMMRLDLETRVEQRCDEQAAGEVSRKHRGFNADKVIAYALSEAKVDGPEVTATGALVRSRGHWYRLTFHCRTTPDGLGIVSFDHQLGAEVPGWDVSKLYHGD